MKKFYLYAMLFVSALCFGGCYTDDNLPGHENAPDYEDSPNNDDSDQPNTTIPPIGWQESADGTLCTYRSETSIPHMPYVDYFVYSFKDGICTKASYNLMFETEALAEIFYNEMMEDDEDDEDVYSTRTEFQYHITREGKLISKTFIIVVTNDDFWSKENIEKTTEIWTMISRSSYSDHFAFIRKHLYTEEDAPSFIEWDGSYGTFTTHLFYNEETTLHYNFKFDLQADDDLGMLGIIKYGVEFESAALAEETYEDSYEGLDFFDPNNIRPVFTLEDKTIIGTYQFCYGSDRFATYNITSSVKDEEDFKCLIRGFLFYLAYTHSSPILTAMQ